jgi:hypothetical protein
MTAFIGGPLGWQRAPTPSGEEGTRKSGKKQNIERWDLEIIITKKHANQ